MSGETTLRAHLEAQRALLGEEIGRETVMNLVLLHKLHEHAVAALALLEAATWDGNENTGSMWRRVPDPDRLRELLPDPVVSSIATRDPQP